MENSLGVYGFLGNLIQNVGVIGGLLLGAFEARRAWMAMDDESLRAIANERAQLEKTEMQLPRVLLADLNLVAIPPTAEEAKFLNNQIVLYLRTWRLAKRGGPITLEELALDAKGYFAYPLPRAIWEQTKENRNPEFVRFIEEALDDR